MNRAEKRKLEKSLGLFKQKNKLSIAEQHKKMKRNIADGKQKQREMKEVVRLQKEGKQEAIDNNKISSLATELMVKDGLSYIQALEEAKTIIEERRQN